MAEPALAADDHPVDALQRQFVDRTQERLDREEPDGGGNLHEVRDTGHVVRVLDRDALPDVRRPGQAAREVS